MKVPGRMRQNVNIILPRKKNKVQKPRALLITADGTQQKLVYRKSFSGRERKEGSESRGVRTTINCGSSMGESTKLSRECGIGSITVQWRLGRGEKKR